MIKKLQRIYSDSLEFRVRYRLHSAIALLVIVSMLMSSTGVMAAPAIPPVAGVNNPPILPHAISAFPQRDFVSADGYAATDLVVVKVIHPDGTGWSTDPNAPIVPVGGLVEVNHPGAACWFGGTPDIRPGDVVQYDIVAGPAADLASLTVLSSDATTVQNIKTKRPVVTQSPTTGNADGIVTVQGSAQDAAGNPMPSDQIEIRLIIPNDVFTFNGRRSLRAVDVPTLDGIVAYDAPGSVNWTATFSGLDEQDVQRALSGEAIAIWLGANPVAGNESTLYEVGAGITAGPQAPCTAPMEILPPPPGSELVPPSTPANLAAVVSNSNTVTLTWDASTDNVGVTSYGVYRDGLALVNVQNFDGSAPAPTTFVDYNVPAGTHSYTVDAADEIGNRSGLSNEVFAITTIQVDPGAIANEPPANGHMILAFPTRDFISSEGYQADEHVDVFAIRNGIIVSSALNVIPAPLPGSDPGSPLIVEVNHPGGACWGGITPDLRAGDIVRTITYGPDNAIRSVDQIRVSNVTGNKVIVIQPATVGLADGILEVHGTAQDLEGNPIPVDQLEHRLVSGSKNRFDLNGRRDLRADAAGAAEGDLSYDTNNNPTGTNWTAVYTGLTAADIQRAIDAESIILWLGRNPLVGNEATLYEVNLADPPGPSPAFCTSPLEAIDVTAPSAPASLTATPIGANTVQLNWSASTDDWYVFGYRIMRDGQLLDYVGGSTLSYTDLNVPAGLHTYTVAAFDSASPRGAGATVIDQLISGMGQRYGNVSAESPEATNDQPDVTTPSVPANLVSVAGPSQVSLTWSASTDDVGVAGYGVYRDSVLIGTVTTNSYVDTGLAIGSYTYAVDAFDATGNRSAQSSPTTANVVADADVEAPSIPQNVFAAAANIHGRDVVITWSASTDNVGVASYGIYRDGVKVADVNGATLFYTDAGLATATYSYTVDAADSAGNRSAQSAASLAVIANDPPLAPHSLIGFPSRDFISADGYTAAEGPYVLSLVRNGVVVSANSIMPDAAGLVEVNHAGSACWQVTTPDMRPGDVIRITSAAGITEQTTIMNVTAERPVVTGPSTIVVHGTAMDAAGAPLPIDQLEHRFVSPGNLFELNGRRTLRAGSGGTIAGLEGTIAYDAPGSIHWTATYTDLNLNDVVRAEAAESLALWLGRNPLSNAEGTIFENGLGIVGGPATPDCLAPAETPVPAASFTPATLAFGNVSALPAATSAARTVTFTNSGSAVMTLGNIYIAGLNPTDFARSGGTCPAAFPATLAAGASCTVLVTFSPSALGARQAKLAFSNDAANTAYQVVVLTGTGIDTTAPNAPATIARALVLGTVTSSRLPINVTWAASTSAATGPSGNPLTYELQQSSNGGANYVAVTLASPSALNFSTSVIAGSYSYRVRACYGANCSAWRTTPSFALGAVQENNTNVSYGGKWTSQSIAGSYGGQVRYAATNKDKVTYRFTGTSVAFITTKGPNRGIARILIDGVNAGTVDLYSATQQTGQIVFVRSGLAAGSHSIVVQVLGTRNTLSTAARVDVDGFATLP